MVDRLALVNEQLDDLLLKQLELIQDYITVTVECESHQKAGFINLAKARYIQGFHSVSRNCLYSDDTGEERTPIVTVTRGLGELDLGEGDGEEEKDQRNSKLVVSYEEPKLEINTDSALNAQLNNQFGVLSSTTLKTARTDFRKCLEKTMERVKIVEQSGALRERYKELMKEKLEMKKESKEEGIAAP